ncbi:GspH/FimT family pseudopilin [Ralstonia flatus]|jgi:general secretion pathway protein H|uniref:Type II secretion system protein H n=1 Tax=Ralstonia flatus TaxID=3058601 RepID=A0AAD2BXP7_9RALS|nr:GspH/FimT family pseudopilin [Ralstonia sp. LMG 32965]MBN6210445.1 GspH/FimT family pseudopilin [Ralstonia pickettii]CAJ0869293.1 hypothetical protein R77567_02281 [Ralstonia sp. LMG 32965]CAJ0877775.1 hypothetical protein R77564_02334 [Ralstonia sp. LMG 32965]
MSLWPRIRIRIRGRDRSRAFTLLEMLVVVVIIGIVMGAVVVNAQPSKRNVLEQQAQQLVFLLYAARDEARLRAQPIVWEATPQGYRFLVRERDTWQPLQDDVLRGGAWREPLSALSFMQAGRAPQSGTVRVLFGREAIEPAITIRLARDDAQVDIVTTGPGRYVVQ